jgi:hypothetical protein
LPRPQPRPTLGLDDQKEDNQRAEEHRLQIRHEIDGTSNPVGAQRIVEKDREQHDKGGTEGAAARMLGWIVGVCAFRGSARFAKFQHVNIDRLSRGMRRGVSDIPRNVEEIAMVDKFESRRLDL